MFPGRCTLSINLSMQQINTCIGIARNISSFLLAEWVLWNIDNLKEYGHQIYPQDNNMVQDFVRSPQL